MQIDHGSLQRSILPFSMCSDEKLLQFLMSKDFTARYAGDDDQYEEERYLQERHQNIPPKSLIEQMVGRTARNVDVSLSFPVLFSNPSHWKMMIVD